MRAITKEAFFKKLNKRGPFPKHCRHLGRCWLWEGCKNCHGYGATSIHSKFIASHRLAYLFCTGPVEGIQVLHKCDNPACCRPTHLFAGDHCKNMQDMWDKNRHVRLTGQLNSNTKLNEKQVLEIRSKYGKNGITAKTLGAEFGVTGENIKAIAYRKTWKFI